jgi:hypothetical protein
MSRHRSPTEGRQRGIAELGWHVSQGANLGLMRPAVCMIEKFLPKIISKGENAWVLKQACNKSSDRT